MEIIDFDISENKIKMYANIMKMFHDRVSKNKLIIYFDFDTQELRESEVFGDSRIIRDKKWCFHVGKHCRIVTYSHHYPTYELQYPGDDSMLNLVNIRKTRSIQVLHYDRSRMRQYYFINVRKENSNYVPQKINSVVIQDKETKMLYVIISGFEIIYSNYQITHYFSIHHRSKIYNFINETYCILC